MKFLQIVPGPFPVCFSAATQAFDTGQHNSRRLRQIDFEVEYKTGIAGWIQKSARFMNPGQDRSGLLQNLAELTKFRFRQCSPLPAS